MPLPHKRAFSTGLMRRKSKIPRDPNIFKNPAQAAATAGHQSPDTTAAAPFLAPVTPAQVTLDGKRARQTDSLLGVVECSKLNHNHSRQSLVIPNHEFKCTSILKHAWRQFSNVVSGGTLSFVSLGSPLVISLSTVLSSLDQALQNWKKLEIRIPLKLNPQDCSGV